MAVDMKQSHRRLFEELWGNGNFGVLDELCDRGYRAHDPVTGDLDLEGLRQMCRTYRTAFPDLKCTILSSYADGDTVVTQWRMNGTHRGALMGIEPTKTRCTCEGITIGRFKGGKLAEEWTQWDALGLFRQLGATTGIQAGAVTRETETRPHAH